MNAAADTDRRVATSCVATSLMRPILRGSIALLALTLHPVPPVLAADANPNPCASPQIAARLQAVQQQSRVPVPVLYDGVQPLRRVPINPVSIAEQIGPACVLLTSTLIRRGGEYFVEDAGYVAAAGFIAGGNRTRGIQMITNAAAQVLREIVNQEVLPVAPQDSGRYLVAIPLWGEHPLYQRRGAATPSPDVAPPTAAGGVPSPRVAAGATPPSGASATPTNLSDRGWPEAQLLSDADGVSIYLLTQRAHQAYFAVVRAVRADQPLIDVQESKQGAPRFFEYGPETTTRFRERILPLIRPNAYRLMDIEVWHYVKDVHLARLEGSGMRHPLTGSDRVEVPAVFETWALSRRTATEPFTAWAGSMHFGVRRPDHNTVAEIRALQSKQERQLADNNAQQAVAEASRTAAREARTARLAALERERARVYPSAGLEYRAPEYWQRYRLGTELRAVFDGDFPEVRRQWEFAQIYRSVVRSFSRRCDAHIPKGSPELRVAETSYDRKTDTTSTLSEEVIRVREAWAAPYEWWDKNLPQALPRLPPSAGTNTLNPLPRAPGKNENSPLGATTTMLTGAQLLARVQLALRDDMPLLFNDGCMNPVLTQLQENMRRMALGLPTLQAERAPQLLRDWRAFPHTVTDGCQRDVREDGSDVGRNWCSCLEQVVNARTTVGERWKYLEDYKGFMRALYMQPTGGPNDPGWGLYQAASACVR